MTIARDLDRTSGEDATPATDPANQEQSGIAPDGPVNRRQIMRTAAIAGTVVAAGAGLAACGSSALTGSGYGAAPPSSAAGGGYGSMPDTGSSMDAPATTTEAMSGGGGGAMGTTLASTSEIPVGGGKVFAAEKVVVTQPSAGTFKAFSSTCTHVGCTVNKIANGVISCPCHGSEFSASTGSVKHGPAQQALPAKTISVQNNKIVLDT